MESNCRSFQFREMDQIYSGMEQLPLTSLVKEGVHAFAGTDGKDSEETDILRPVIGVSSFGDVEM